MAIAAAAVALLCASASAATFAVDVSSPTIPLRFPMLEATGSGHASLALRADYRRDLASAARDIGFRAIRGHGVLDDDLSSYLNGHANLFNAFSIYDFYLSVGMKPVVELSFMPEALANDPTKTIMHYKGITSPPKNYTEWGLFVGEFVQALVDRYTVEEVRTWRIEVWNEPNSCGFWCGGQDGYFKLYQSAAAAIKAVDPLLLVGGPATASLLWVPDMLNFTKVNGIPLDFLSTHAYPSDPGLPAERNVFEQAVAAASALAAAESKPFVLTEYSYGWCLPVVDDPYSASFAAHVALAFQNVSDAGIANVDAMSWWAFSDIFEEPGFYSSPYAGVPAAKMGLQTNYGVPKPAYRSFQLIASLRGLTGVPVTVTGRGAADDKSIDGGSWYGASRAENVGATSGNVDVLAGIDTTDAPLTTVRVLVTNFNVMLRNSTLPIDPEEVQLTFANIPASRVASASATFALIDSTHAYAKPTWVAAGSPVYPTVAEIAAEMAASQLVFNPLALTASGGAGSLVADLGTLEPYATAMVVLQF